MKTLMSERGQVVIPKKIRDAIHINKGDELDIEVRDDVIVLKPLRRFKAKKWQDYAGIGAGIVSAHLKDKKKEKANEDVYP
ncbi:MAG TPA: AbrB/MazE/SpoVT family DNA-binding domain-containing protein [Nitrospirota bacterium]